MTLESLSSNKAGQHLFESGVLPHTRRGHVGIWMMTTNMGDGFVASASIMTERRLDSELRSDASPSSSGLKKLNDKLRLTSVDRFAFRSGSKAFPHLYSSSSDRSCARRSNVSSWGFQSGKVRNEFNTTSASAIPRRRVRRRLKFAPQRSEGNCRKEGKSVLDVNRQSLKL